jgi:hypothetical protein
MWRDHDSPSHDTERSRDDEYERGDLSRGSRGGARPCRVTRERSSLGDLRCLAAAGDSELRFERERTNSPVLTFGCWRPSVRFAPCLVMTSSSPRVVRAEAATSRSNT